MNILFLAANPLNTTTFLDLEEELRSLALELKSTIHRSEIRFNPRQALRPDDLVRHAGEVRPNVVHFSGHGSAEGIVVRNDAGGMIVIPPSSFKQFLDGREIALLVLNSCYSRGQAMAAASVVGAVVGTTDAVEDEAARRFTIAFYRTLGNGGSIRNAFKDGRDSVAMYGLRDDVFHCGGDLEMRLLPKTSYAGVSPHLRNRALAVLAGYEAALCLAYFRMGRDVSVTRASVDEYLRQLDIYESRFPKEPVGAQGTGAPVARFISEVLGTLGARSEGLKHAFSAGFFGVMEVNSPGSAPEDFSLRKAIAGVDLLQHASAGSARDLLEELVARARQLLDIGAQDESGT